MATLRQVFHDIAESIRAKGVSGTMKPIDMAQKIDEIKITDYLIFTSEEDTTLTLVQNGSITAHKLLKSTDAVNWVKWENPSTNGISLKAGESVYIKDDEDALHRTATSDNDFNSYSSTGRVKCNGSLMPEISLNPGTNDYSYFVSGLFKNCATLTTPPELPATTLANACYRNMFENCHSLTTVPSILPATTLADSCYRNMFNGCTSLTSAPELPATTLAGYCYKWMFGACSSLVEAPQLPATTLAPSCYDGMFYDCTSLTQAPQLPATTLADYCYQDMFKGCTSLVEAPELPATTLAPLCYFNMFFDCRALKQAPQLPATDLANGCYFNMFSGCTSLEIGPELPATDLAEYCYDGMFYDCTSLKRVKMNASSSSSGLFGIDMFSGCTSLELVDMTGSVGVTEIDANAFLNTNDTYKIVVPDSLYDTWITTGNWASIASHIMKQSDWNAAHPDDILGQ